MIHKYKIKIVTCALTGTTCIDYDCSSCEISPEGKEKIRLEQEENELRIAAESEQYTNFDTELNMFGHIISVNDSAVLGKLDLNLSNVLVEKLELRRVPYHPAILAQYPQLRKLRRYNNLGIPDTVWARADYPLIIVFGDVGYMLSPISRKS